MKRLALAVATLVLTATATLATAPAYADSRVDVTNDRGGDQADLTYQTALTIRGSGFQVVRGGFGGVYLMFGWVDDPQGGSWRPSRGGLTGQDYQYIPDSEDAADNKGYLKFIAFPGSSTASEAAAVLSDRGSFTVDLTVPGPVFQAVDRSGSVSEVDCREVTCGVITIGAHGVKNASNETFTPVSFGDVYTSAPPATPVETPSDEPTSADTSAAPVDTPTSAAPGTGGTPSTTTPATTPTTAGVAALAVDRATAVSGRAMTFSATGFAPGEQVVATLDDGVASVGPMVAGTSGEVAGVLQLPADLGVGTHTLRMTGAASGTELSENFPVAAGAAPSETTTAAVASETDSGAAATVFLVVAALILLAAIGALGSSLLRRRRRRAPAPTPPTAGAVA